MTVRRTHDSLEIETGDVNAAVAALLEAGVPLDGLRIRTRTLEDLFLELTGKALRGEPSGAACRKQAGSGCAGS